MSLLVMMNKKQNALTEEINDMTAFLHSEAFIHLPEDEKTWHSEQLNAKVKESDELALATIEEAKREKQRLGLHQNNS